MHGRTLASPSGAFVSPCCFFAFVFVGRDRELLSRHVFGLRSLWFWPECVSEMVEVAALAWGIREGCFSALLLSAVAFARALVLRAWSVSDASFFVADQSFAYTRRVVRTAEVRETIPSPAACAATNSSR